MFYKWIIAMRPWSFTASFVPIAFGAVLAWVGPLCSLDQGFRFILFVGALLSGVCLQAGTNLLNTYGDYISGVDTIDSAKTCPQIVTGIFSADSVRFMGILMFLAATVVGFILFLASGWPVLVFGAIGLIGGYTYTTGFAPYKYKGLGPFFVFFLMGPFMVLPSYYIQTKALAQGPFFASLPIAFLVVAIMHANDLRDIAYDRKAKIQTLAMRLGLEKSIYTQKLLFLASFVFLVFLGIFKVIPVLGLLPLVLLPKAYAKLKKLRSDAHEEIVALEGWTAQFHFLFGLVYIFGVAVSRAFC